MIDLSASSKNDSDDRDLSRDEVRAFAVNTLSRLISQNIFDALLAATERAVTTLDHHDGNSALIRESVTSATSELLAEIKTLVSAVALSHDLSKRTGSSSPDSTHKPLATPSAEN